MTKSPSQANANLKGIRFKNALVGSVLSKRSIEEQRRFVDYFVQGIRVDGRKGWLEAAFYEDPSLPGGSFCMVPPTGLTPNGRAHLPITYQERDFPQPPVHSKRGRPRNNS